MPTHSTPTIIAHGELLIDFVPTVTGVTLIEAPAFIKAPGGAPANVAVGLARLGEHVGFVGQVGDDAFGHFLAQTLHDCDVDVSALTFSTTARTALAFVSLKADGDRDFMFYRHPSADMLYAPADVDANAALLQQCKVFHFGSISLIHEPARSATLHAIALAKEAGAMITYDPNLRLPLWENEQAAREGMLLGMPFASIVKISEEELEFLTGINDWQHATEKLWHKNMRLLLVTRGKDGCYYRSRNFAGAVAGFAVDAVDATGAGDAFMAGMIHSVLNYPPLLEHDDMLRAACRFANAAGAITTMQRGAIPALPTKHAVLNFLQEHL